MTKKNLITVAVGTTLEEAEHILHQHRVEKLLVVNDHYELKGLITVKDIQKKLKYPNASKDDQGRLRVGAAIGATGDFLERAAELIKRRVMRWLSIPRMAIPRACWRLSGSQEALPGDRSAGRQRRHLRGRHGPDRRRRGRRQGRYRPGLDLHHPHGHRRRHAADHRHLGGFRAAQERKIPVIADGGIKYSGDVTKAIAAGATSVMIGSLFAGVDESPGETILYQGRSFKTYRGMGSLSAMAQGSGERYFQSSRDLDAPEVGCRAMRPARARHAESPGQVCPGGHRGPCAPSRAVESMVYQLVGGLRSGMGYLGCGSIEELQKNARFIRISNAGLRETHVHDVIITREAPNYHVE